MEHMIFTSNGTRTVTAYAAGRYAIVHRSYADADTWTVTHRRTGLAFGPSWPTLAEATAVGRGVSIIIAHYGDAGTFGNGSAWDVNTADPLTRYRAMVEFFTAIRRHPDSYLDGMGELQTIRLTGEDTARYAAHAIRLADNVAWLRDGVTRYGLGPEGNK
jgi:hypothetical protein